MAKRRNKTKAKRRFAGLDRKVKINGEIVEKMMKMETKTKQESVTESPEVDDLGEKVQVTENGILTDSVTEKGNNTQNTSETDIKKMSTHKGRKPNKNKQKKKQNSNVDGKRAYGKTTAEEVLIYPTEIDGETCIEIKCGNNEAHLYLSKLSLGSKGACIHYSDSWLTPNEFQSVSGRETAKDWKRSIRHKGRSLKMLISKGLITVQSACPRQVQEKSNEKTKESVETQNTPIVESKATEAKTDEVESAVGGNEITLEQKANTKQTYKKRGRKPKKLRRRNAMAKVKLNTGAELVGDVAPPPVSEIPETKQSEEIKTASQDSEKFRSAIQDDPETKLSDEDTPADDLETKLPDEDAQADEERRLDEFVKSLRLTKAVGTPKSAPELSTIEKIKDVPESTGDEDPEMPILQKEADILPEPPSSHENDHLNVTVNVDTFHATVTPPPTPPGDNIMIERKTDDEKLVETFTSRLASPSDGVKLTINRDKVNIDDIDNKDSVTKLAYDVTADCKINKPNMQTLLLQDALQSAKKYKEQLKQNMQTLSPKPVIRVPNVQSKADDCKIREKSVPRSTPPSVIHKFSDKQRQQVFERQADTSLHSRPDQHSRRHVSQTKIQSPNGLHNSVPSAEEMKNLAGMSFQELLAGMSSIYGPPPFPVDTKDAAFAALQEMHRRHEMLRLLTQGQVDSSSSSILYPMMTPHILLAMTQQLYSMYNMPGWLPSTKPSSSNPETQSPEIHHLPPSNSPEIHHRRPPQMSESQHRRMSQTPETKLRNTSTLPQDIQYQRTMQSQEIHNRRNGLSLQKRKHSEPINDCAIDLSVKRRKTENDKAGNFTSTEPANLYGVSGYDAPLDFSLKKTNYQERFQNKRKDTERLNGSFNMFKADYSKQMPAYTHVPESNSTICTCDRTKADDITTWSVERVCYFLRGLDGCAQYAKTFHEQGISGRLLPYLTTQHLTRTLGMKVGPALTLIQAVERRFRERQSSLPTPHRECVIHQPFTMPVHI